MRSAMRLSAILAMLLASPLLAEDPPLAEILQDGNVAAKKQALGVQHNRYRHEFINTALSSRTR